MGFNQTNIPLPGISGGRDEVTGVTNLTISRYVSTLEETLTVGDARFMGLRLRKRALGNWDGGNNLAGYQVDLTYDNEFPDEDAGEAPRWSFDTSFREERIQKHPLFKKLKAYYGWVDFPDGTSGFPEIKGASGSGSTTEPKPGLNATGEDTGVSPAFGFDTYLQFGAVAEKAYLGRSISAALKGIGHVFSSLPQGPSIPQEDKANWLKMPPRAREVKTADGEMWEISEQYMLSKPGGWPPMIYKLIQGI
jgi:hypothetical protein